MGQVPNKTPYGIVGDGRVARHFAHYLNLKKIPYKQWSRSAVPAIEPAVVLAECETILVLISDSAIEPWIEFARVSGLQPVRFVHFSGALVTSQAAELIR